MSAFFFHLEQALEKSAVALATVVATKGSTPRGPGARLFLPLEGAAFGTVGGGRTEGRVLQAARETLQDGQPRCLTADLGGHPGDVRDGICGGTMTIWITRLTGENSGPTVRQVHSALEAGKSLSMTTNLDADTPLVVARDLGGGYEETLQPAPRLLVVGAGHIGRCLADLATRVDFSVTVQDERPEWLDPAAFPMGCHCTQSLTEAVDQLQNWQGDRFAALVTRGFAQDVAALSALKPAAPLVYLGLLGSRKRLRTVLDTHGEIPPGLHAPAGARIGAETPEEIAVSIIAEMIQVRRSRLAQPSAQS